MHERYCQYLSWFLDRSCLAGLLCLGTDELFQVALMPEVIFLRISRAIRFRDFSGEAVGKHVGTPDAVQLRRAPEWSIYPLCDLPCPRSNLWSFKRRLVPH